MKNYTNFNKEYYTRTYLYADDSIRILLLSWNNYQKTIMHEHSNGGCLVRPLYGKLMEQKHFNSNNINHSKNSFTLMKPDNIYYIDNTIGSHKIQNLWNQKAATIHIYQSYTGFKEIDSSLNSDADRMNHLIRFDSNDSNHISIHKNSF